MTARHPRLNALLTLACAAPVALALTASAGGAVDAGTKLRFSGLPQRVLQGGPATVTVAAPAGIRCTLTVRYADGILQPGLNPAPARNGRAQWSWRVPETAATGPAKLVATCGKAGRVTAALPIVAGPKQPGVTVAKEGFSQRFRSRGSTVSYGIVLTNTAADRDALDVLVLTNFVDATDTVLGTDKRTISGIPAGAQYYLGDYASLPSVEVVRLEITIQVGSRTSHTIHEPPVADLRIVPTIDGYVGAVVGQVTNDRDHYVLTSAAYSSVLFDAEGNIVGGSYGRMAARMPRGVRAFFRAGSGGDSTPYAKVAVARVSVEARFEATG